MEADFWSRILALVCLFGFVGCDGGTGGDSDSTTLNPPQLTGVNPTVNNSSVNLGSSIAATFDKRMNVGSA
ncbi:hypothetical protein N9219_02260, partial [bacterium]|nr:hypothetical protein [bacterium]